MIKKVLLILLGLIVIGLASAYFYFTAGEETYPEIVSKGIVAPDFQGIDQRGQALQLSELTKKGPVVLVFYRGLWCPACQQHLAELQSRLAAFVDKGASVLAITPQLAEKTNETVRVESTSISIIHDENNQIMNDYRVGYQLGKGSQRLFSAMGIDLEEANGNSQNTLPIPAIFVIGEDGRIQFTYEKAGGFVPEYLPVEEILAKLSE